MASFAFTIERTNIFRVIFSALTVDDAQDVSRPGDRAKELFVPELQAVTVFSHWSYLYHGHTHTRHLMGEHVLHFIPQPNKDST